MHAIHKVRRVWAQYNIMVGYMSLSIKRMKQYLYVCYMRDHIADSLIPTFSLFSTHVVHGKRKQVLHAQE